MARKKFSVAELVNLKKEVAISEEEFMEVRPLSLTEMVTLFLKFGETFLQLYGVAVGFQEKETNIAAYSSFLLAAPELVARIVATASDSGTDEETIKLIMARMPATAQLEALLETMKLSVPDAKKARELLSEVTTQLQRLWERKKASLPQTNGATTSPSE